MQWHINCLPINGSIESSPERRPQDCRLQASSMAGRDRVTLQNYLGAKDGIVDLSYL
jgi:hypothetical protein